MYVCMCVCVCVCVCVYHIFIYIYSQVQGALKGEEVAAVACGEEFTVAITAERGVYVWGLNNCGQVARHRVLLMCC